MKKAKTEPLLTAEEMAGVLRVKPKTVLDWTKRFANFPHLQLPGSARFRLSEVMDWIDGYQKPGRKEAE